MTCDCCGKKKKLLDMFWSVGEGREKSSLCSECWNVVERLESDVAGGEKELYGLHLIQLKKRAQNPSETFLTWQRAHFPENFV